MTARGRAASLRILLAAATIGCGAAAPDAPTKGEPEPMTTDLAADLASIRARRVVFAHHSVGVNVLAGVERLDAAAGGGRLRLVSFEEAAKLDGPVLAHGGAGRNQDPRSKIDGFARLLRGEPGLRADVAFMKLCYVDFEPGTDVEGLFAHYRETIEALRRELPGTRLAHVTVPVFRRPSDVKSSMRRLLGKEVWEDAANVKRAEYNELLRRTFAGDPIFDLSRAESTAADGTPVRFERGGRSYPSLNPEFTEDGGHLNEAGQRAAGAAAVRFLGEALRAAP
jgi:hypothetical protein